MRKQAKSEKTINMKKQIKTDEETDTEFLARLMAEGFERMDERFERVDERFERASADMRDFRNEVNERFDRMENILYRGHENRIEKLEDKIAQIQVILGKKLA